MAKPNQITVAYNKGFAHVQELFLKRLTTKARSYYFYLIKTHKLNKEQQTDLMFRWHLSYFNINKFFQEGGYKTFKGNLLRFYDATDKPVYPYSHYKTNDLRPFSAPRSTASMKHDLESMSNHFKEICR